jgi:hypothetical protein
MKNWIAKVALLAATFGSAGIVRGHHSFSAHFVPEQRLTIEGVVTEFWFANPHSRIYVYVVAASGESENWMVEGQSRNVLIRRGWSEETIESGTTVTIVGSISRDGSKTLGLQSVVTAEGVSLWP